MCLDVVSAVWSNICDNAVNVPEFGIWILDGYVRAYCDLREVVGMGVVEVFSVFSVTKGCLRGLFHAMLPLF